MNNKKIFFGFLVAFIVALNLYHIPFKKEVLPDVQIQEENQDQRMDLSALELALNSQLNRTVELSKYRHVIVNFWASWCPSCKQENLIFNQFFKSRNDVLIVGISVDKNKTDLDNYLTKTKLNYTVGMNSKGIAVLFDDIVAVPTHFFINTATKTVKKSMGLLDENELKSMLGIK